MNAVECTGEDEVFIRRELGQTLCNISNQHLCTGYKVRQVEMLPILTCITLLINETTSLVDDPQAKD